MKVLIKKPAKQIKSLARKVSAKINSKGKKSSKFNEEKQKEAIRMAEYGLSDRQVAHVLDIQKNTIKYHKKDPGFFAPYKEAKEKADERVRESLYQKCLGYTFPEEKIFMDKWGGIHRVQVMSHTPPDVNAIRYWLNNRQPEVWKEPKLIDVTTDVKVGVKIDNGVKPEEVTDEHRNRIKTNILTLQRYRKLDPSGSTK